MGDYRRGGNDSHVHCLHCVQPSIRDHSWNLREKERRGRKRREREKREKEERKREEGKRGEKGRGKRGRDINNINSLEVK